MGAFPQRCPSGGAARWARIVTVNRLRMSDLGGPGAVPIDELGRRRLRDRGDGREVTEDHSVGSSGATIDDTSLVTGPYARTGPARPRGVSTGGRVGA